MTILLWRGQSRVMMPSPSPRREWRTWAAVALGALGLLNMAADLASCKSVKGLASASTASPLPKVFSDVNGLETFASEFLIGIYPSVESSEQTDIDAPEFWKITPELYARLAGSYNRRNVYGAALAYAPRLPEPLWQQVFCFAMRPGGPLRAELQLPAGPEEKIIVLVRTRTRDRKDHWWLNPPCSK